MQVKKFEGPTIQEALDQVKAELGPDAIILQTKKVKKALGFGGVAAIEITAAVSEKAIQKKQAFESRIPEANKQVIRKYSAEKQAEILDQFAEKNLKQAKSTQDQVSVGGGVKKSAKPLYIDMGENPAPPQAQLKPKPPEPPQLSTQPPASTHALAEEVKTLKKVVEELKSHQNEIASQVSSHGSTSAAAQPSLGGQRAQEATQKLGPFIALDHPMLQEAYEHLVINGVDRKYAFSLVKKVGLEGGEKSLKSQQQMSDLLAGEIMENLEVSSLLSSVLKGLENRGRNPLAIALIGPTGVG
ncbi:MAG: hypothetical protein ACO3A2_11630, partial [Bdellovibrionia bacterium]